jgi:hypothetical protein
MGRKKHLINLASLITLLFIGWIDYVTGYEFGFFIFYFIPVSLAAWFVNRRSALFMACASAVCWYLSDLYTFHPYSNAFFIYWEVFMRLVSFLTTALTLSKIKAMVENERCLIAELSGALDHVRDLQGLLPVCPGCGELNAEDSLLEKIKNYLASRSNDELSPHLCPTCRNRPQS